jgi:hypothetical protein
MLFHPYSASMQRHTEPMTHTSHQSREIKESSSGIILQAKSIRISLQLHYEQNRNSELQWLHNIYLRKAAQRLSTYIKICKYRTDMNKCCSIKNREMID